MSNQKKVVEMDNTSKKESAKSTKAENPMKEIFSLSEQLETQLKEINRKKKLVDNRNFFILKKEELQTCVNDLITEDKDNKFNTERFTLKLARANSYREEKSTFSISNVDVLLKFVNMLMAEIDTSINAIESELLK